MKEDILKQINGDDLEEDLDDIEEEIEQDEILDKESIQETPLKAQGAINKAIKNPKVKETYEAVGQPSALGIVNTITGEGIEGFDLEKDTALVRTLTLILNKQDKIAIAAGV